MTHERTTSAGYRFPLSQRPISAFHERCIPADKKANLVSIGTGTHKESEFSKCDQVTEDTIWKQSVAKEKRGLKSWETSWGFLTEFDDKGRPKSAKQLPETCSLFSENIPNTNAGNYGSRLNTEVGKSMQQMEFLFNSQRRKKKLGSDMICY